MTIYFGFGSKKDAIWTVLVIVFVVASIIFSIWWAKAQWNLCMSMFNNWFYCIAHIS